MPNFRTSKRRGFSRAYLLLAVLALAGPFVPLIIASVAFRWSWPDLLPSAWWWQARGDARLPVGWDYIFSPVSGAVGALLNTVVIALLVTLLCTVICLPAARVLATRSFPGKSAAEFILLTPLIVPEIAVGLGVVLLFSTFGLTGSYLGVVLAHLIPTIPYLTRVLTASFQGLGANYEAQARVLGAGPLQAFWLVTMPLLLPGLLAGWLFVFLVSSNLFLLTFLVGRGQIETLPTLLFAKLSGGGLLDPVAAGLALLASLPGVVLLLLLERTLETVRTV